MQSNAYPNGSNVDPNRSVLEPFGSNTLTLMGIRQSLMGLMQSYVDPNGSNADPNADPLSKAF